MAQALIAENEIDLARRPLDALARRMGARRGQPHERGVLAHQGVRVARRCAASWTASVQLAGGMGTSEELVLGRIYRDIRSFRIYDGATEVHKMSIAKRAARRAAERIAARETRA